MKYLPTVITGSNFFLGILSLYFASTARFQGALFLILLTAFLDFADGYLARRLNAETKIGGILDSVSDLVCFVLAPPFYIFMLSKGDATIFLLVAGILYFLAGTTRLIRYTVNKLNSNNSSGVFLGCPVTAVAISVAASTGVYNNPAFQTVLLFLCAYLMVSGIRYTSLARIFNDHCKEALFSLYILLVFPFFIFYPLEIIFALSFTYLIFYPLNHLCSKMNLNFKKEFPFNVRLFPFAKGTRLLLVVGTISLLMSLLLLPLVLRVVYLVVLLALAFFFRDPERIPQEEDSRKILSPTDGRVIAIEKVFKKEKGLHFNKVSIFLSILDVHVNRSPAKLRVLNCEHYDGGHLDARHPEAGENEHNLFTFELVDGKIVVMKQIAGKIARRILSYVKEGDTLEAGERLGAILFGSRIELFLPDEFPILVKEGEVVKAALTAIGAIKMTSPDAKD